MFSQLPMYQRIGAAAYKADLNSTIKLCKSLGNPQKKFKSIHIAGTNGKGSVSHYIASVLQSAGYKTGLYTSPHIKDFRERIKINGNPIEKENVCSFIENQSENFKIIKPSFFEMTAAMAYKYFADEEVDIAVIETGMGGRLDSTNVVSPILTIITNIGIDHTAFLGDTIEKIAMEKAGIIKNKIPLVIGEITKEIEQIFLKETLIHQAPVYFANHELEAYNVSISGKEEPKLTLNITKRLPISQENRNKEENNNDDLSNIKLKSPLTANYQINNLITVMQSLDVLNKSGFSISKENCIQGIANVTKNTGIIGRWQILQKDPTVICDIGHNIDGIRSVVKQLENNNYKKLHFVLGMVNDKNYEAILSLLPKDAIYYFCKPDIPRGLNENTLSELAHKAGLSGKKFQSTTEAFEEAKSLAKKDDLVFVGGSTFVVAEIVS